MPRIIGGLFGLQLDPASHMAAPAWLGERTVLTASGRSALRTLALFLQPRRVWLPSYLCAAMLLAFDSAESHVCFYPIDRALHVQSEDWLGAVSPGDLVVFVSYFGFATWHEHAVAARRRGAWVVEDACQAMLNEHFDDQAQYVVVSPRKFVGVPDGGALIAQGDAPLPTTALAPPPRRWWLQAFAACAGRGEFDRHGGTRAWFESFQAAEAHTPSSPAAMSEFSQFMLNGQIDLAAIAAARRSNYEALARLLPDLSLFPALPPHVVPLGFPVRLADRDGIRGKLFQHEIYAPTHWPIAHAVPETFEESQLLSLEILTLPCDQRCDAEDMDRLAALLRAENASAPAVRRVAPPS